MIFVSNIAAIVSRPSLIIDGSRPHRSTFLSQVWQWKWRKKYGDVWISAIGDAQSKNRKDGDQKYQKQNIKYF